jgi:hypothetical protein
MLTKSQSIVMIFGACMILILALLIQLQILDLEIFFVICFISFYILTELLSPFNSHPEWKAKINLINAVGIVIFILIIVKKLLFIAGF